MNIVSKSICFMLSATLVGCAVHPIGDVSQDIAQAVVVPAEYIWAPQQQADQSQQQWWRNLNSGELNQLVNQALANNQDLVAAGFRWRKALLAIEHTDEQQGVQFNGNLSASVNKNLRGSYTSQQSYGANLGASYQIDLWSKLAAQRDVSMWRSEASAADLASTQLSLVSEVVNAYLQLVYTQDQLSLNNQQIDYQQESLARMKLRYKVGDVSELEVIQSEQQLTQLLNTRSQLRAQHRNAQTALSVLLGQAPAEITVTRTLADLHLPAPSLTPPAYLLHQRPDLRAMQYQLQASLGDIAVAERDFYPSFNLSAGLSTHGGKLSDWLQNPTGNLVGSLLLPFLQHHEKELALQSQTLQYQEALAGFVQALYQAMGEVENALSDLQKAREQQSLLDTQLRQAQKTESLMKLRYNVGDVALQDWLNEQENLRQIERQRLDNRLAQLRNVVSLHQALGGNF